MGEWRCTFDYSIFIVYLSYIYGIFIVYLSYVVGKKGVGSREQGARSKEQGVEFFGWIVERRIYMLFVDILDVLDILGRCATLDD